MADKKITLLDIRNYFGYEGPGSAARFRQEWTELTPEDQVQIKGGLQDGTLTY